MRAQPRKDTLVLAMTLEPPGLDPTAGAASAIAEVVLYNIFETLTKINSDGRVTPLLAESWEATPDGKVYTFHLRADAKWSNGDPITATDVLESYRRMLSPKLAAEYAYRRRRFPDQPYRNFADFAARVRVAGPRLAKALSRRAETAKLPP